MAATTSNQLIKAQNPGGLVGGPANASENLYQGTMAFFDASVGDITGDDNGGANAFAGIVKEQKDNSSGATGDLDVEVYTEGVFELVGSGFAQSDVGDAIYAIDNWTIQKSSTSASFIGTAVEFISATKLMVKLEVGSAAP
tara:strand:- start:7109 stop:7531 length:423 start_codon:yes stop_codon:yes gene_type:complete